MMRNLVVLDGVIGCIDFLCVVLVVWCCRIVGSFYFGVWEVGCG